MVKIASGALAVLSLAIICQPTSCDLEVCDWKVYYDTWIPKFKPGEFEHAGAGILCLEACCQDPNCKGIAIQSSLQSQCYKFSNTSLDLASSAPSLAEFLTQRRVSTWSILLKGRAPVNSQQQLLALPAPELGTTSEKEGVDEGDDSIEDDVVMQTQPSSAISKQETSTNKRSENMQLTTNCQWAVHYDTWVNSFEKGEYLSRSGALDGVHCLDACCQDPSCQGLALESAELYQCYKYGNVPKELKELNLAMGQPLKDGAWLRQLQPKWSIFIKNSTHDPVQPIFRASSYGTGNRNLIGTIVQICGVGAFIMLMVGLATLPTDLPWSERMSAYFFHGAEAQKLLHSGVELLPVSTLQK